MSLERILDSLDMVREQGGKDSWMARCPAHDDGNPSLHVTLSGGKVLLKCFAGCDFDDIVSSAGLEPADLFLDKGSCGGKAEIDMGGLTDVELARYVKLPVAYLREAWGVKTVNAPGPCVEIPVGTHEKKLAYRRHRMAIEGKGKFRQPRGVSAVAYNAWRADEIRSRGAVVIVEGESDCWTLHHAGIDCYGVPGASMARSALIPELFEGVKKVFVFQEPDKAGRKFAQDVGAALTESDWFEGKVRVVNPPSSFKDPSELWKSDPKVESFKATFRQWLSNSSEWRPGIEFERMLVRMDKVQKQDLKWFMPPYIPRGLLTLIAGIPGIGKSTAMLSVAAKSSRGEDLLGISIQKGTTLVFGMEDSVAQMTRARLEANGADLSRVFSYDWEQHGPLTLDKKGRDKVLGMIDSVDPDLVILDPIVSFAGDRTNINNQVEVRRDIMAPLQTVAQKKNIAIVLVAHTAKGMPEDPLDAILGSRDFTAAPRSVMLGWGDPDCVSGGGCIVHQKCNVAPTGATLRYRLMDESRVEWIGTSQVSWDQLKAGKQTGSSDAVSLIRDAFARVSMVQSRALTDMAQRNRVPLRAIMEARELLGIWAETTEGVVYLHAPEQGSRNEHWYEDQVPF